MKLFRQWTKRKTVLSVLVVLVLAAGTYGVSALTRSGAANPGPAVVHYSGNNGIYSVQLTRFTDYDAFRKALPSDVMLYDDKNEMKDPPGRGFLVGGVAIQEQGNLLKCEVELIRENGIRSLSGAYNMQFDRKTNPVKLDFLAYDYPDSAGNRYKSALVHTQSGIVEIPLQTVAE